MAKDISALQNVAEWKRLSYWKPNIFTTIFRVNIFLICSSTLGVNDAFVE